MNKRGIHPLLMVFECLAAFAVIFIMTSVAKDWATGEDVKIAFLTKDSALMVDALHATPGNVVFNYKTINYTRSLQIETFMGNSVQTLGLLGPIYTFPFRPGLPRILSERFTIEQGKEDVFQFVRSGPEILFGKDLSYSEKLSCLNLMTGDPEWRTKTIAIDPQLDADMAISENNRQIASALFGLLKSNEANVKETRSIKEHEERTAEERIAEVKDASMIVSISTTEGNVLNVYFSDSIKSRKFACLIANDLMQHKFDSVNIVPSGDLILKIDAPSVVVQFGNKNIQSKIAQYGDGIYRAVREYYG